MQELYQHFHKNEIPFVDQVLEWKRQAQEQYAAKLTDFLDPRQQDIVELIVGKDNAVRVSFYGGQAFAERKRALLYPDYYCPEESDYQIKAFQVNYPAKFVSLEHPQILGSLMSIGLKREKFGDILMENDIVQLICAAEISDFVHLNMQSIGKIKIRLEEIQEKDIIVVSEQWENRTGTVSSLRLDTILSEIYRLSRQKTLPYIQSGLVKVNWKQVDNPSYELKQGDYLSVRGQGRSKILEIEGKTKKDKWKITFGLLK